MIEEDVNGFSGILTILNYLYEYLLLCHIITQGEFLDDSKRTKEDYDYYQMFFFLGTGVLTIFNWCRTLKNFYLTKYLSYYLSNDGFNYCQLQTVH